MSRIVVSHAFAVDGSQLWYPGLATELRRLGHQVSIPALPDPGAPSPAPWLSALSAAASGGPAEGTVLVGHSLGGVNILRLLERHDAGAHGVYAGVVLVATMAGPVGYDDLAGFFPQPTFDWDRIRLAARRFRVLVAGDDPVLVPSPFEHVRQLVNGLGATAVVPPDGGHLPNWSPGAVPTGITLPQLTDLVLDCLPGSPDQVSLAR
jgi:predicted alpha/beta hydrolase family esterase